MDITIINPDGLHRSEVRAIQRMRETLRSNWTGYAAFEVFDHVGGMEFGCHHAFHLAWQIRRTECLDKGMNSFVLMRRSIKLSCRLVRAGLSVLVHL